jgi:hypothetical protein
MNDWKTTLFGLAAGALNMFANGVNWKNVLLSSAFGLLGIFAADSKPPTSDFSRNMK